MRQIFEMSVKRGFLDNNIMKDVERLTGEDPDPYPLSYDEVQRFLQHVNPYFIPFFSVAFYSGMRFGEIAVLKWNNVWLNKSLIRIRETLVYGEEGRPKTKKSKREIDLLPEVIESLEYLLNKRGDDEYVFRDEKGRLLTPDHVREVIWKPAILKAELKYRPMIQTRHTFATMMIDAGEDLGWVQNMLGHATLQMIFKHYHAWIKKPSKNDGSAFTNKHSKKTQEVAMATA